MKKGTLTLIAWGYTLLFIICFSIYAMNVMDSNWEIDFTNRELELYIILIGGLIGLILHSIDGAGVRDQEKKISKNTILAGISIAVFFLVWRMLVSIF